jgi:hypothetical protein
LPWTRVRQPGNRSNAPRQNDPPFGSQPL